MKKSHCMLVLLLVMMSGIVAAQKRTITGKVTDQTTGTPLTGVNILANKQKGGVVTKTDGTYSITVEPGSTSLIFSYVGFATQTVAIDQKTVIDIVLVPAAVTNDEVVVIGY